MKHYVRRSSRNQIVAVDAGDQQHQDNHRGPASNTGSQLTAKEQEAPDPYSFEFEDKQVKDTDCTGTAGAQASQKTIAQGKKDNKQLRRPTVHDTAVAPARTTRRPSRTVEANTTAVLTGPVVGKCVGKHAVESGEAAPVPSEQGASEPAVQQAKSGTAAQELASCITAAAAPRQASASAQVDCGAASGGQRAKNNTHASKGKPLTASDSQGSKAASSGRSRKATQIGIKRSRDAGDTTGAQDLQGCSPPDAAPRFTAPLNPAHTTQTNSTGAVTLPTPHHRSRSSRLLAVAAAAAGGTEARPAQTVMEAQERGELVQMQDDASYAMDGLSSTSSLDTQRDSAVVLAEMLSTRKGRVALRADGLSQQYLTRLAKLKAAKDPVLALSATLSLSHLAAEDANPCYLASIAAAVLMDQLLQHDYTFEEVADKSNAGARLCRLTRSRPLSQLLASAGVNSMRGLLLVTLEQATSSMHASKAAAVEKLKHNLRQHGALQRLAGLVSDTAGVPAGAASAAQQLHLLLLVLENATFTCLENGAALTAMRVKPSSSTPCSQSLSKQPGKAAADAPDVAPQPFPAVLVSVARQLLGGASQEQPRTALHALLSVMMNLIHDNKDGGALLCSLGAMDVAAEVYSSLLQPAAGSSPALCAAVLEHLELLSVALGVLMNLVSNEPQHSNKLAAVAAGGSSGVSAFVKLLCTVVTALGQMLQKVEEEEAAAATDAVVDDLSGGIAGLGGSVRASPVQAGAGRVGTHAAAAADRADGIDSNTSSEASIVELYSGILLGFLVRDGGPQLAQAVAGMLPGCSLDPLMSSTARCLEFYMRTGAITDHTRVTLEGLLRELRALETGLKTAGQGLGGGAQGLGRTVGQGSGGGARGLGRTVGQGSGKGARVLGRTQIDLTQETDPIVVE